MWKTVALLVLAAWPALAQGQTLTIANQRLTFGFFGPKRADAKYLPGDLIILAYDLKNISFDKDGTATFAVSMELTDAAGKSLYKQPPRTAPSRNYLGGNSVSAIATQYIPPDFPPGTYTLTVTVEDKATKARQSIKQQVQVLPANFGLVMVGTSLDPEGRLPISPVATVGESLYLNVSVAGFAREKTGQKLPNVSLRMRILDENGKDTMPRPIPGKAREDVPPDLKVIPAQFPITLNRVGRYTIEVSATCEICGKTAKTSFPLRVLTVD